MIAAKTSLNRAALLGGAATFVLALAAPTAAWAQPAQTAAADAADDSEIVVTGSLIKNPNLVASTPVNVTTAETIQLRGSNVAEEVLRDLPGVVPNIGSAVNNGNGGASFVDLRGLGANRNIVLLDGRRLTPSGLAGQVDLNNIPLALIQRVDALTGAAVTTYGADAISGVVNFVTKKDFTGVDLQLSNGITERGDGRALRADLTIGGSFSEGRGNAVLSLGYQTVDPIYQGARDISERGISSFSGNAGGGSPTTTPSRLFGIRGIDPVTGRPSTDPNVANIGNSQVSPDGSRAIPFYQDFNFNPYNIFQTPFQRFNIFAKADYQVSDTLQFHTRGLFSKNSVRTIIAPSGLFAQTVTIPLSNPFLNSTIRNQYCAFNTTPQPLADGTRIYTPRFSQAVCDAAALATNPSDPNYRTIRVPISRRTVEAGPRSSEYTTTIFDYEAGLGGKLTNTVDWDVTGSYGQSENIETATGYVITTRVDEALAATNPNTCLSNNPLCVPLNVFGPAGSITPAMAQFFSAASTTRRVTSLAQVRALVSGDIGQSIPWASDPVGFAIGAEYRDYYAAVLPDVLSEAGQLGGGGGPTAQVRGSYNVTEVYGEIIAPVVQDKPFFHNLTVEAGARYSSYNVRAPGNPSFDTFTWKAGGSWEVAEGYKLRGNYSRAVRSPNIGELFSPPNRGLTNLGLDPCAGDAPVNNANLRAICLAQGAQLTQIGFIEDPAAGQANNFTSGSVNLRPEVATTWTVGGVIQPSFAPGLALTVDYYNILVNNAITAPTPGDVIAACFGNVTAASATSQACLNIVRNPDTGSFDGESRGLLQPTSNSGRLFTDGVDVTLSYSRDLGFAKLGITGNFNYTFSSTFQALPGSVNRECVGYFSPNCSFTGSIQPQWQSSLRTTFGFDWVDLSLLWRHIDGVIQEPLNAAAPADVPPALRFFAEDSAFFPAFRRISSYDYFDLSARFHATERVSVIFTVNNLTDNSPPLVGSAAGSTAFNSGNTFPSTYDALGRRYTMQINVRF